MRHRLTELMRDHIAAGLKRKTLATCSKWTQECVVMGKPYPGPLNFRHHPWQREMHDSDAPVNIGEKSAQMGYSTTVIDRTFFKIDVERTNVLYLLPTKTPDATDFSADKFDKALENSPHLAKLFSSVRNVGLKRAGSATLWIRGMNSRSALKSIDPSFIVFDELDEMDEDKIPLAEERMAGQKTSTKQIWKISTPTAPDFGINKVMQESTQEHFFFDCPHCGRETELTYSTDVKESCLVVCGNGLDDPDIAKSYIRCKECKKELPHGPDGKYKVEWLNAGNPRWLPTAKHINWRIRGFHINQLYSTTVDPEELARWFFRSLRDAAAEQEFYNSKLGLPHIVDGARISQDMILDAIVRGGGYDKKGIPPNKAMITMGVDIGKVLHYVICQWHFTSLSNDLNVMAECKVLDEGGVISFNEIEQLMMMYRPQMTVFDSEPETRTVFELASKYPGRVKMCKYTRGHVNKMINVSSDSENHYVTVDRTAWLDMSLGRFKTKRIVLPKDVSYEFKQHLVALIKRYKEDKKTGNPKAEYLKTSHDHLAHALNYAEIALPLAASLATNRNIERFL